MTGEIIKLLRDIRHGIESQWGPGAVGWESVASRIDALLERPPGRMLDPQEVARKCWEKVGRSDPQEATHLLRAEIENRAGLWEKAVEFAAKGWLYEIGVPLPTTNCSGSFKADSSR